MKQIVFFLLISVTVLAQEPRLHPTQMGLFGAGANSFFMSDVSGGGGQWASSATAATALQAGVNYWSLSGDNVYRPSGNVGVGTPTVSDVDSKMRVLSSGAGLRIGYNNTSVNYVDANLTYFRNSALQEIAQFSYNSTYKLGLLIMSGGDGANGGGSGVTFTKDGQYKLLNCVESFALGGTGDGGLAYVYGNNPYSIMTNGSKRIVVTGDGNDNPL